MSYSARTLSPIAAEATAVSSLAITGGLHAERIATAVPAPTVSHAQAPEIVREIRAIGDRLSAIERNSVEVRFQFSSSDSLSVRVEVRDGTVHTTFKTDSADVRDAIAREWHVQAANVETRPYKVAEPIFTASSSNGQNHDLSSGGNGARQQQSASDQQPFTLATPRSGFAEHALPTAGNAAPAATRPESSRHLHVFA